MKIRKDIAGQRFGRLVAIAFDHVRGKSRTFWMCQCDCGNKKAINVSKLLSGWTQSCGCYHKERLKEANLVHGHSKGGVYSKEFRAWTRMIDRCTNKNGRAYKDYGARGITVCDRWLGSETGFLNFFADMGEMRKGKNSVGRIDNNGPYCPENCRWEDKMQQAQNTRATINITWQGRTQCRAAWARELGLTEAAITYRLKHWDSVDEAFSTPSLRGLPPPRDKTEAAGYAKQGAVLPAPEWELTG